MVSFLAKIKFFRFWPNTMDYNKAFLPKSRRFSAVLLFHSGRCYEAEICAQFAYKTIWCTTLDSVEYYMKRTLVPSPPLLPFAPGDPTAPCGKHTQ